jgi:hypothetical protein
VEPVARGATPPSDPAVLQPSAVYGEVVLEEAWVWPAARRVYLRGGSS